MQRKAKTGPKGPTKRTYKVIKTELTELLEWTKRGVPTEDGKRSAVYLKHKLCFNKPYTRDQFRDAIRYYEEVNQTDEFSHTISEIDRIIENRLFEMGLTKRGDASIVRLGLSANYGWVTEKTDNKNDNNSTVTIKNVLDDLIK